MAKKKKIKKIIGIRTDARGTQHLPARGSRGQSGAIEGVVLQWSSGLIRRV
jgi:hypothetical protein